MLESIYIERRFSRSKCDIECTLVYY